MLSKTTLSEISKICKEMGIKEKHEIKFYWNEIVEKFIAKANYYKTQSKIAHSFLADKDKFKELEKRLLPAIYGSFNYDKNFGHLGKYGKDAFNMIINKKIEEVIGC